MLHLCRVCRCLFWKSFGESCPVSFFSSCFHRKLFLAEEEEPIVCRTRNYSSDSFFLLERYRPPVHRRRGGFSGRRFRCGIAARSGAAAGLPQVLFALKLGIDERNHQKNKNKKKQKQKTSMNTVTVVRIFITWPRPPPPRPLTHHCWRSLVILDTIK